MKSRVLCVDDDEVDINKSKIGNKYSTNQRKTWIANKKLESRTSYLLRRSVSA